MKKTELRGETMAASESARLQAALTRDALALVDETPSKEEMEGYADRVKNNFLKNLKLTVDLNLQDSEEFVQEAMVNIAKASGIKATVSDIQKWSNMSLEDLAELKVPGVDFVKFSDDVGATTAQAGLDVAGQVYGEAYSLFSLTDSMVSGGTLDVASAIQLGATAVSLASTVVSAAAGGAALGPYGAVAGVVLAGISYLSSSKAREQALWDQKVSIASQQTAAEAKRIDEFNATQKEIFWVKYKYRNQVKDEAVSEVADNWSAFEEDLGVRFGLRYFPGSAVPMRAGLYRKVAPNNYVKNGCTSLSGCLYFPEPTPQRVATLGFDKAQSELIDRLASRGLYLANPDASLDNQYVFTSQGFSAYHDRTLRAFSAYVGGGRYWNPPHERMTNIHVKSYANLLDELGCEMSEYCDPIARNNPIKCNKSPRKDTLPTPLDLCNEMWDKTRRSRLDNTGFAIDGGRYPLGEDIFNQFNAIRAKHPKEAANFSRRAFDASQRFWADLMGYLERDVQVANVFKTRINGDLLQSANAVGGELATALRLKSMLDTLGSSRIADLTQSEKHSVRAISPELAKSIDRRKSRDGLINNTMLAAGAGALGFGAWKKWG